MDLLKETLKRQASQIFSTILTSIEHCPAEHICTGNEPWNRSIGDQVWHIAICLDYTFPCEEYKQRWKSPFTDKQGCLDCLKDCRDLLVFPYIENQNMLEADPQPEYFISRLDRLMKLLRHVAQHTGAIHHMLGEFGVTPGNFVE